MFWLNDCQSETIQFVCLSGSEKLISGISRYWYVKNGTVKTTIGLFKRQNNNGKLRIVAIKCTFCDRE